MDKFSHKSMYESYFSAASNLVATGLSMKLILVDDGFTPEKADEMISAIGDDVRACYEESQPFVDAQKVFDGTMTVKEYTLKALEIAGGRK